MGWKLKVLALLVGLMSFGAGVWPIVLLCFAYLLLGIRPKHRKRDGVKDRPRSRLSARVCLAGLMLLLSAVALYFGGTFSPLLFSAAGGVLLLWPTLLRRLSLGKLVPVSGSILLRSKYFPMIWCAVAEVKPGAEPFPLAVSSFSGTLLVNTDTGRTYSLALSRAFGRGDAEARIVETFRSAAPGAHAGAYLLPLDADTASDVLRHMGKPIRLPPEDLPGALARVSCFLALDCARGVARRVGAFEIGHPSTAPGLPGRLGGLESSPLTWEVFDAVGKRTRFPEPDGYSNLLDSMLATKGVPFAERVRELESSEGHLKIRSLSGEEVRATRTQLRALVSIYS